MALIWPLGALAMAVSLHAVLVRLAVPLNVVGRFIVAGALAGLVLATASPGLAGADAWALLTIYAFLCELYVFLFTMVSSSVSAWLLVHLLRGGAERQDLEARYPEKDMVEARLRKLAANGLVIPTPDGYRLSARGRLLVMLFDALRRFFHHRREPSSEGTAPVGPAT